MVQNERNLHDYGWGKISEVSGCYICILDRQLKAGGEGQKRRRANLFPFDRTICRFFNVILTPFLPQELTMPLMLSSNFLICWSLPALGCYFRQEIVIIAGLACLLFDQIYLRGFTRLVHFRCRFYCANFYSGLGHSFSPHCYSSILSSQIQYVGKPNK